MNNVIKKVLVSEKSFQDAALGKFSFIVDKFAGKLDIATACEELFKVTVLSVNTTNYKGKVKFVKRKKGKRADFKKAILTLKKGDKIDLFEIESTDKAEKENKKSKKAESTEIKDAAKEAKKTEVKENKDVSVTIKKK